MMRTRILLVAAALLACRSAPSPAPPPAPGAVPAGPVGSPADAAAVASSADRDRIPPLGPTPALRVPRQQHFQLSNGLKVRLVEYHRLPIVALHLVVDAGASNDPPSKPGLASFTAAMLTEGTRRRTATQISDDIGFIGASLGAGAGPDAASLSGSSLSARLDTLLDVFADVLVEPSFPEADFERVQDQRVVALLEQNDQPGALAAKTFAALYWGDHPYGHWTMGTEASVKAMRRDDLVAFHRERWQPGGSELVVVGDVTQADLAPKLERALAAWKGGPSSPRPPTVAPPAALRTVLVQKRGAAPQSYVIMGMAGLDRSSPEYVAAQVAFEILGGGSTSRLFRNLREKEGYTYGIYSRLEARKLGGTSLIVGSVRADATGAATRALLEEISGMRRAQVAPAELDQARSALQLSLPSSFAEAAGIAAKLAEEVVYGLPDDYWDSFAARLGKVTAEDVQRIAEKYLDPARLTTVMVCDPQLVKPQLAGLPLGTVEVRPAPATGSEPARAPAAVRRSGSKGRGKRAVGAPR